MEAVNRNQIPAAAARIIHDRREVSHFSIRSIII